MLLFSSFAEAQQINLCSISNGVTVVYINGILTESMLSASDDRSQIKELYNSKYQNGNTKFELGYNPSRGVALDVSKAIMQTFLTDAYILDTDLHTIVRSLKDTVKTDKIVIIGHSQGAFYANALYKYLVAHGVPPESLAVYAIATPASEVAGYGFYYTSTTDKLINTVRDVQLASSIGLKAALPGNFTIPLSDEEAALKYGGHSLRGVYLTSKDGLIVYDINESIQRVTSGAPRLECIPQPELVVSTVVDSLRLVLDTTTRVISFLLHALPTASLTSVPESALPKVNDQRVVVARSPLIESSAQTAKKKKTSVSVSVRSTRESTTAVQAVVQSPSAQSPVNIDAGVSTPQAQQSSQDTSYTLTATAVTSVLPQSLSFGAGMGGGGAPITNDAPPQPTEISGEPLAPEEILFDHLPEISITSSACIRLDPCVVRAGEIPLAITVRDGRLLEHDSETIFFSATEGMHTIDVQAENNMGIATASFTIDAYTNPVQVQYAYALYPSETKENASVQCNVVNNTRHELHDVTIESAFGVLTIATIIQDAVQTVDYTQIPRHEFFDSLTQEEGAMPYTLLVNGVSVYTIDALVAPFVDAYI